MKIIKEGFVSTNLDTQAKQISSDTELLRHLRESTIAETDAINMYEKLIDSIELSKSLLSEKDYASIVDKINEIIDEEKTHFEEFQSLIYLVEHEH